jgi:hypothetical protein
MYAGQAGGSRARAFERHRASERALEEARASLTETKNAVLLAEWENKTHGTIEARMHAERMKALRHSTEEELKERRRRLSQLYERDAKEWREEVLASVETTEQIKERMLARALQLKAVRDEERRGFVQAMYDKQWRDSCDDARNLDSKAMLKWIAEQRKEQLDEREALSMNRSSEEDEYMAKVEQRVKELVDAEQERDRQRLEAERQNKDFLSVQIRYNHERLMDRLKREAEEDAAELAALKRDMEMDAAKERQRREEAHARGREVLAANSGRLNMRAEAAAQEREQDLKLLEYAMERDNAGKAEEMQKREAEKMSMRNYRSFLQEQMIKEAQDQSALDEIRLKAENEIWDARDAELAAREEARRRLLEEVHEGRAEQLRLKALREEEEKRDHYEQLEFDARAQAVAESREREEAERRVQERRDQAAILLQQVEERAKVKALEAQDEFLQTKRMEAFERAHAARLEQQAGKVVVNHPLKSGNLFY